MRVAILRRAPRVTFSMDVYADQLVGGLRLVRPHWDVIEVSPQPWWKAEQGSWKSGTGLKKYYERFWNHPRHASRVDADIFHIIDHTDGHIGYWLKRLQKPFVITCHDLVQFIYPEILRDQARFPLLSLSVWKYSVGGMKDANRIVTVSSNTKNDVVRHLDIAAKKVEVIPNAVSSEFCGLPSKERQQLKEKYHSSQEICLLNVGSTHQRKNIITVLKVIKVLRDRGLSARLWRTGAAFTDVQRQFIEAHNLTDAIVDFGLPDRAELIRIYNAADILLAPSLYEGFGLTVLEAMACGLPVITSNTSSLPEVSGNAAILVDPLAIDQIVEAVRRLIADAHYRESLVTRGIQRAKTFTWQKTAEQVAQVYEETVRSA